MEIGVASEEDCGWEHLEIAEIRKNQLVMTDSRALDLATCSFLVSLKKQSHWSGGGGGGVVSSN